MEKIEKVEKVERVERVDKIEHQPAARVTTTTNRVEKTEIPSTRRVNVSEYQKRKSIISPVTPWSSYKSVIIVLCAAILVWMLLQGGNKREIKDLFHKRHEPTTTEKIQSTIDNTKDSIINSYEKAAESTKTTLHNVADKVKSIYDEKINTMHESKEQNKEYLKEKVSGTAEDLKQTTKGTIEILKEKSHETIEALKEKSQETIDALKGKSQETIESLKGKSKDTIEPLKSKSHETLESLKGKSQETLESLKEKSHETLESLKGRSHETLDSLKGKSQDTIESLKGKSQETIESLKGRSQETIESLKDRSQETIESLKGRSQETVESLKDKTHEAFDTVRTTSQGAFDTVRIASQGVFDTIKTASQGVFDSIKTTSQETVDKAKETFVETQNFFHGLDMVGLIEQSYSILQEFMGPHMKSEDQIPFKAFSGSKAVVFLTVVKGGIGLSGAFGTGIIIARNDIGHWSGPCAIALMGVDIGLNIGVEKSNHIIILHDDASVKAFSSKGQIKLGIDASIAVGPKGRETSLGFSVGDKGHASMFSYSLAKGAYLGLSFEGQIITVRNDCNEEYYGEDVEASKILDGTIRAPKNKHLATIYKYIDEYAARKLVYPEHSTEL